jgi:hypothetical protein
MQVGVRSTIAVKAKCLTCYATLCPGNLAIFETSTLVGTIPTTIGLLANLGKLNFWTASNFYHRINLTPNVLENINLSNNRLTGTIPSEIGQLSRLGKHRDNHPPQ